MRIRELIGLRDVVNCILCALALTLLVCGGAYLGSGGPVPKVHIGASNSSVQKPAVAAHMNYYRAPARPVRPTKPILVAKSIAHMARTYTVRSGDCLSSIAARHYGRPGAWTVIYWANKHRIEYADIIRPGQVLVLPTLPQHMPAAPAMLAPLPPRPVLTADAAPSHASTDASSATPVEHVASTTTSAPLSSYAVTSALQACIIRAESGGRAQVTNASGHWGLYQFSYDTWIEGGGSPGSFGNASAAEQTQVFWNIMNNPAKTGGALNWTPYDGC